MATVKKIKIRNGSINFSSINCSTINFSMRTVVKLNSKIGVSHSVSRENPNSNAVRGSSSSSARNKLSSISFYLLITILINIIFIQCNFWFKLFEWRRYVSETIDLIIIRLQASMQQQQQEQQHEQQHFPSAPITTIILDRFSTMQYFWFRIRHLFPWSQFILFNLLMHLVQLFIRNIYLNCTLVASTMTIAATAVAARPQPIKPNANAIIKLQAKLFINNDADNDNFTDIIDHDMNLDHTLFCRDAANQQTIIQNKQTDQL